MHLAMNGVKPTHRDVHPWACAYVSGKALVPVHGIKKYICMMAKYVNVYGSGFI